MERIDGFKGLPYTNLTSLAIQRSPVTGSTVLHIGSAAGSIAADITPMQTTAEAGSGVGNAFGYEDGEGVGGSAQFSPLPVAQWVWSYRFLERWLPGPAVASIAAHDDAVGSPFVLVATQGGPMPSPQPIAARAPAARNQLSGCGFALYEDQLWTLSAKAERMAAIQTRHSRYGMSGGCDLGSFGDTTWVAVS